MASLAQSIPAHNPIRNQRIKTARRIVMSHPGVRGPSPHQIAVHQVAKVIKPSLLIKSTPYIGKLKIISAMTASIPYFLKKATNLPKNFFIFSRTV